MILMQYLNMCIAAFKNKQSQPEDVQRQKTSHQTTETESILGNTVHTAVLTPFTLETSAGKPGFGSISLLKHVRDPCIFQGQMRHFKNGKAPCPDGIPNEMLKHLPEEVHQVIHKLFILMWMTGTTPKAWKESQTVLLHKKGSEHDLGNWRPIALANTLHKLWTGVVAEGLYKYAEYFNILSN